MFEIAICSRKEVPLKIAQDKSYAVIAFFDYPDDKVEYPKGSVYKVLELHTADVTAPRDPRSMDEAAAVRIIEFVNEVIEKVDILIVCCSAGISRSSAVAAAVIRGNGMDDGVIWDDYRYSPNPLCYERVLAVYGIIPKNMKQLQERSRMALHKKIEENRR